ncbi:MAG: hypothetical protein GEU28_07670 [Dehalococcoidia bacterium]|nr:hypothetical protein [Dehalococcoidia bacterium]
MTKMRRKGTDEVVPAEGQESPALITVESKGSGTADALHVEHPEFVGGPRPSWGHRLLDLVRKPFRD